jgi:hypothetical protein
MHGLGLRGAQVRRRAFCAAQAASLFSLSACAIFKEVSYFAPKASSDVVVVNTYRGLPEIARFRLASTQFSFAISQSGDRLVLWFELAEGESARFTSKEVQALALGSGESVLQDMEYVTANVITAGVGRAEYTPPTEQLIGSTYMYKKTIPITRRFTVFVNFNKELPTNFRLKLPNIIVSGTEYSPPVVEFSRAVGSAYQGMPP